MKIYIATGHNATIVEIHLEQPMEWMGAPWRYWEEEGLPMLRVDAQAEFEVLPTHGSREVIEYELKGNGMGRVHV